MDDSEKMSKLLLELRMSAEDLGKSIGKRDGDVIRHILKGRNKMSVKVAKSISEVHNIRYEWLLTGEGDLLNKVNPVQLNETNEKQHVYSSGEIKSENMDKLLLTQITLALTKISKLELEVEQLKKELGALEEKSIQKDTKSSP